MYNIPNALRRHADAAEPEVFGTNAFIFLLLGGGMLLPPLKLIANMTATDRNAETS